MLLRYLGITLLAVIVGCTTVVVPAGDVSFDLSELNPTAANAAWSRVLDSSVDWRGRIDFKGIAQNPDDLYLYIAYVGKVSPKTQPDLFPTPEEQLAYYINSYNALVMYGIIQDNFPEDFINAFVRARFFKHNKFIVGGEKISLLEYENNVIRPMREPRIHFALNRMVVSEPELPRTPFNADTLHEQLNQAARKFVNDPMNVQVIEAEGLMRLTEKFRTYEKEFVNNNSPTIVSFLNQYLDNKIEGKIRIKYLPYDWTIKYP